MEPFTQALNALHSVAGSTLLALVPVAVLLLLLAVFGISVWQAVILGSAVTLILGSRSGTRRSAMPWAPTAWGGDRRLVGGPDRLLGRDHLQHPGGDRRLRGLQALADLPCHADIRVQTLLLAWAFGALMEGLVGFGYPWASAAPILIALGVADLAAIRVAAIANNAPVSYGALGASIGKIVAILALLPPWILIYLVSGRRGLRDGWPLAIVGSLGYIVGQFPIAEFVGPYLPDIIGSLVCFAALLGLLRVWRPRMVLEGLS